MYGCKFCVFAPFVYSFAHAFLFHLSSPFHSFSPPFLIIHKKKGGDLFLISQFGTMIIALPFIAKFWPELMDSSQHFLKQLCVKGGKNDIVEWVHYQTSRHRTRNLPCHFLATNLADKQIPGDIIGGRTGGGGGQWGQLPSQNIRCGSIAPTIARTVTRQAPFIRYRILTN